MQPKEKLRPEGLNYVLVLVLTMSLPASVRFSMDWRFMSCESGVHPPPLSIPGYLEAYYTAAVATMYCASSTLHFVWP
jgi:hypothetical protein